MLDNIYRVTHIISAIKNSLQNLQERRRWRAMHDGKYFCMQMLYAEGNTFTTFVRVQGFTQRVTANVKLI